MGPQIYPKAESEDTNYLLRPSSLWSAIVVRINSDELSTTRTRNDSHVLGCGSKKSMDPYVHTAEREAGQVRDDGEIGYFETEIRDHEVWEEGMMEHPHPLAVNVMPPAIRICLRGVMRDLRGGNARLVQQCTRDTRTVLARKKGEVVLVACSEVTEDGAHDGPRRDSVSGDRDTDFRAGEAGARKRKANGGRRRAGALEPRHCRNVDRMSTGSPPERGASRWGGVQTDDKSKNPVRPAAHPHLHRAACRGDVALGKGVSAERTLYSIARVRGEQHWLSIDAPLDDDIASPAPVHVHVQSPATRLGRLSLIFSPSLVLPLFPSFHPRASFHLSLRILILSTPTQMGSAETPKRRGSHTHPDGQRRNAKREMTLRSVHMRADSEDVAARAGPRDDDDETAGKM
ncbi:hypothetical protein B0H12DRAFT_1068258 [Mycena haematopus]|nr:hypothetical protein B0H12DRAFT_1068258 [Mycena haematopus]